MKRRTLLMATMNKHKFEEVSAILNAEGISRNIILKSMNDIGFYADIPEEEDTLEGNASAKTKFVHKLTGMDCFSDDTGLEVVALNGSPGVRSARYAGDDSNSENNIKLLLKNLEGVSDRRARFRTVISLIMDEKEYLFEGIVEGEILEQPQGREGFGYDPVFRPAGYDCSFAEMPPEEKNIISHRYQAIRQMIKAKVIM